MTKEELNDKKEKEIYEYWRTNRENGIPTLMKVFGLSYSAIDKAIEKNMKNNRESFGSKQ